MDENLEVNLMLFNVMVTRVFLYGIEVWGGTIIHNAWKQIGDNWDLNPRPPLETCV